MSEMSIYQCCFCGQAIAADRASASISVPLEDGASQDLYSHPECLQQRLHPSVPFVPELVSSTIHSTPHA